MKIHVRTLCTVYVSTYWAHTHRRVFMEEKRMRWGRLESHSNFRGKHFDHQIPRLACCASAVVDTSTQTLVYTILECSHRNSVAGVMIQYCSVAMLPPRRGSKMTGFHYKTCFAVHHTCRTWNRCPTWTSTTHLIWPELCKSHSLVKQRHLLRRVEDMNGNRSIFCCRGTL